MAMEKFSGIQISLIVPVDNNRDFLHSQFITLQIGAKVSYKVCKITEQSLIGRLKCQSNEFCLVFQALKNFN